MRDAAEALDSSFARFRQQDGRAVDRRRTLGDDDDAEARAPLLSLADARGDDVRSRTGSQE